MVDNLTNEMDLHSFGQLCKDYLSCLIIQWLEIFLNKKVFVYKSLKQGIWGKITIPHAQLFKLLEDNYYQLCLVQKETLSIKHR